VIVVHVRPFSSATGFGYRDTDALIAMAMLERGGLCPPLPGRAAA
jgi:hypothetical protein